MRSSFLVLAGLLAFSASAAAADFSKIFLDADGKPICTRELKPEQACPDDGFFTLRLAARNALNGVYQDEQNLSGDEKYKRGEIAQSIVATGEVKLKVEDIALIKRLIGKAYPPPIVFQAWRELDPPK